jgi:hypothetical protein
MLDFQPFESAARFSNATAEQAHYFRYRASQSELKMKQRNWRYF